MPNRDCSSAVTGRRRDSATPATSNMYGLSISSSNQSATCSRKHRRRKWPEALAVLDLQVQQRLHAEATGRRQNRAVAQRARPELHAALTPAKCESGRQVRRRAVDQLRIREAPKARAGRAQPTAASSSVNAGPRKAPLIASRPAAAGAAVRDDRGRRPGPRRPRRRRLQPRAGSRSARSGRRARRCHWRRSSARRRRPGTDARAPVSCAIARVSRSTISSVTACTDAARSMCRCVSRSSGARAGPPNSASNRALVM